MFSIIPTPHTGIEIGELVLQQALGPGDSKVAMKSPAKTTSGKHTWNIANMKTVVF